MHGSPVVVVPVLVVVIIGDGVTGDGVTGDGVTGDGVTGDGVTGDGVTGAGVVTGDSVGLLVGAKVTAILLYCVHYLILYPMIESHTNLPR